jgi:hypothetical protein
VLAGAFADLDGELPPAEPLEPSDLYDFSLLDPVPV